MVVKLILFCSIFVFYSYCQQCANTTYGLEGDSCTIDINDRQSCILALTCRNAQGGPKCTSISEGKLCVANNDCFDPFPDCIAGGCSRLKFPGDSCTRNEDCDSGVCSNSICTGIGDRLPCRFNNKALCASGLFCNKQSKCQAQLDEGEQCDGIAGGVPVGGTGNNLPLTCKPGLYCDVAQQLCLRYHSQSIGKQCSTDLVCENGLHCYQGQCRNPATITPACQGDYSCNSAVCQCTANQNQQGTCLKTYLNYDCNQTTYTSCLETNNCYHTKWGAFANGTCANQNCKCEYIQYLRCLYKATPDYILAGRSAYPEDPTCSASKNMIWIGVLAIISFFIM